MPRPLRNDARPARGWEPLELADRRIRAVPLPVSPCERDISPLPCCPTPPRVTGCRRTQLTNGPRRLMTESPNDAVNSLNSLAGHKNSSFAPRMHVESVDKKHSAFWRHLCDEALRRESTAPGERQGTDTALLRCSRESQTTQSRHLQGTWLPTRKRLYRSRRECTIAHASSRRWGRQADDIWMRNKSE